MYGNRGKESKLRVGWGVYLFRNLAQKKMLRVARCVLRVCFTTPPKNWRNSKIYRTLFQLHPLCFELKPLPIILYIHTLKSITCKNHEFNEYFFG